MQPQTPKQGAKKDSEITQRLLLMLFGLVMLGIGLFNGLRYSLALSWPTTHGIVEASTIQRDDTGRGGPAWCVHWKYRYAVRGQQYTSDHRAFLGSSCDNSPESAQHEQTFHPIGSTIKVIYNPYIPDDAAIFITEDYGARIWLFTIVGILVLLAAKYRTYEKE